LDAQDQLKMRLMRARTELAFLLSDQLQAQPEEVRAARRNINLLIEAIGEGRFAGSGRYSQGRAVR
jgi:hypothetical protein